MKYTNRSNHEMNGALDFIKIFFSMLLIAPFTLVAEISKRIMYIPKRNIAKVLLYAIYVNVFVSIMQTAINIYNHAFYWILTPYPAVMFIASTLILIGMYYYFDEVVKKKMPTLVKKKQADKKVIEELNTDIKDDFNINLDLGKLEDIPSVEIEVPKNEDKVNVVDDVDECNTIDGEEYLNNIGNIYNGNIPDYVKDSINEIEQEKPSKKVGTADKKEESILDIPTVVSTPKISVPRIKDIQHNIEKSSPGKTPSTNYNKAEEKKIETCEQNINSVVNPYPNEESVRKLEKQNASVIREDEYNDTTEKVQNSVQENKFNITDSPKENKIADQLLSCGVSSISKESMFSVNSAMEV